MSVHKKLFNLELLGNAVTLYLHLKIKKNLEDLKKIKILKFAGDLRKLQKKFCLSRQSRTEFMKQYQEIRPTWTEQENFDVYFCTFFDL